MAVNDGQKANDTTFNDAFLSRTVDSDTIAKIDLKDPDTADITDVQATMNDQRTDIDQNRTDIDTNDTELADHESRISTNETNITNLQNDTMDLTTNQTAAGEKTFSADAFFSQDVTITGDLTVDGTTTTLNTQTLDVEDTNITINNGGDDTSSEGSGITVERAGTDGSIVYENALDNKFKVGDLASENEISTVIKDTEANILAIVSPSTSSRYYATDTGKNFLYDAQTTSFLEVGSGGGGGVGDIDYLTLIEDFDSSDGLSTEASGVNGSTFRLTHDASVTKFAEKQIDVTNKFRDKVLALRLDKRSTASSGNFKVIITDETNALTLADEIISPQDESVLTDKKLVTFSTAQPEGGSSVASIKVRFEALAESGSPFSEFDDVVVDLNTTEARSITATVQETNTFSARIANNGTASITSQSESFISSVNRSATGRVDIVYKAGFFTVAPAITATQEDNNSIITVINQTPAGCQVFVEDSAGTDADRNFGFTVTRQGSDYRNIEKRVEREVSTFKEVIQEESDSMIKIRGGNGFGSSSTKIRRFSTIAESKGDAVTYQDSATLGASFTVNESGVFSVTYVDGNFGSAGFFGLSINASVAEQSTDVSSISATKRIAEMNSSNSGDTGTVSWTGILNEGDIVRPHVNSAADSTDRQYFTISKVGVPKIASVAPDSKIEIPTSELRMEGGNGRGTGAEAFTAEFATISKIRGDALSVSNSNGTIVTILKDGKLDVSANLQSSSTNREFYITKNASDPSIAPLSSEIESYTVEAVSAQSKVVGASFFVKENDVIRIASSGNGSLANSVLNITHQEQRIQVAISNIEPQFEDADSMVRLNVGNGYGSTNTKIRRFSSVLSNIGADINYQDSATDGSSFEILETGYYSIGYSDERSGSTTKVGITLNSTQLTSSIDTINAVDILDFTQGSTSNNQSAQWSGVLNKGDIIRAHSDGACDAVNFCWFTIAKVGVPSIAEVDVTPFVDFHENRFQATEWETYSPTYTGFGSVSNSSANYRRNGDTLEVNGSFTAGTNVAIAPSLTLPNNLLLNTAKLSLSNIDTASGNTVGSFGNDTVSVNQFGLMVTAPATNNSVVYFSSVGAAQGSVASNIPASHGNLITGNNGVVSFSFSVPIEGWTSYEDNYERIYAVEQNENEFSARIANNGTASITSESSNFIESVTRDSVGVVTVNFKDGFFTETPSVTLGAEIVQTRAITINSLSLSSMTVSSFTSSAGSLEDWDFSFHASRQGADRKDLQKQLASISDFPRVNNQLRQEVLHQSAQSSLLNVGATNNRIQFNLSNLTYSGDSLLTASNVSDRTEFTALRDCTVDLSASAEAGALNTKMFIFRSREGTAVMGGSSSHASGFSIGLSGQIDLKKNESIWIELGSVDIGSTGNPFLLTITAQAQELERVDTVERAENVFSARIDNTGTTGFKTESSPFIKSVTRLGTGVVEVVFKSGFFTEVPAVSGTAVNAISFYVATSGLPTASSVVFNTRSNGGANSDIDFDIIVTRQGDDYKSLEDLVVAIPDRKVALIEQRGGGTFQTMTTSYATLGLNTVVNDGGFVSLDNGLDRVTLPKGEYEIDLGLMFYFTSSGNGSIYSRLRNVTSTTDYYNMPIFNNGPSYVQAHSTHRITLTVESVFEIQGLLTGGPTARYGDNIPAPNDLQGQIKITKLR